MCLAAATSGYTGSVLLQGLFVPLTCPFYRDGASYLRKLEHNVARYSLSPVAGLIALPPGGEAVSLTDAEAYATLETVGATAAKEKVLIAGIERASVAAALALCEVSQRAGFDTVLLAPPTNWARLIHDHDARELVSFYEFVADRSPLPVILWSDPGAGSLELPLEAVADLAKHSNILGVIDAGLTEARLNAVLSQTEGLRREVTVTSIFEAVTRRMMEPVRSSSASPGFVAIDALREGVAATSAASIETATPAISIKTRSKMVGFQVLSAGMAYRQVGLLKAGAAGAAPAIAACAPQACFEVYAAWKDGDEALANERAARLERAEALAVRLGPAAVKAGCDFNGYYGGHPRLPRLPLTASDRAEVEEALSATRN